MSHQYTNTIATPSSAPGRLARSILAAFSACAIGSLFFVSSLQADDSGMAELKQIMQSQIEMMKPELQKEVKIYGCEY